MDAIEKLTEFEEELSKDDVVEGPSLEEMVKAIYEFILGKNEKEEEVIEEKDEEEVVEEKEKEKKENKVIVKKFIKEV